MKNPLNRLFRDALCAVTLMAALGLATSCSDNYDLDETMPSFLKGSIYDELKSQQCFNYTVRLIDDLGYADVMAKTGSKTLFVAKDDAYEEFFRSGQFKKADGSPVTCYEDLSLSQKRLLYNGTMLNNAFVLEMMTTIQGPVKNQCLRQLTAATATDTIPFWNWYDLPENVSERAVPEGTNLVTTNTDEEKEIDYWRKYRTPARAGIWMATDKSQPLMTHFLEAQMNEKNIKHSDVAFILNQDGQWPESEGRAYIFGNRIVEQDVTCMNGYYHVMDKVLLPPSNMAEVIRTNGQTNYFSQMLDRFSAPYYDANLTEQYKALHAIDADSVFQKIYISQRNVITDAGQTLQSPSKVALPATFPYLSYDPGWNAYHPSSTISKEQDMAAMFVPCDEAMVQYFVYGGGALLIQRYGTKPNTEENLSYNLYQIPLNIIRPLVGNLMKDSFNESVPSKYLTIMNDAQDPMFSGVQYPTVEDYKRVFKKVLMANNGVVYVMNSVIAPATYASVMAPVLRSRNTLVVNSVLHADDAYIESNYANAPLRKFYSTYLLAMQSRFSFFVPTDDGLKKYGYLDPVAYAFSRQDNDTQNKQYWTFEYSQLPLGYSGAFLPVKAVGYHWWVGRPMNPASDTKFQKHTSDSNGKLTEDYGKTKKSLLTEMIDQHIVVHDNDDVAGVNSAREWYLSRSGAPVYIKKRATGLNGEGMEIEGGLQIDFNNNDTDADDIICRVDSGYDMTRETNEYGNGMTYFLSRPIQPALKYTSDILKSNNDAYSEFYNQCNELTSSDGLVALKKIFGVPGMLEKDWSKEALKYRIFIPAGLKVGDSQTPEAMLPDGKSMVRFFRSYRYTVYVPTNAAMEAEYAKGLPKVQDIIDFVETHYDEEKKGFLDTQYDEETDTYYSKDSTEVAAKVTMLLNFLKYHFQETSIFLEKNYGNGDYQQCSTSCQDNETGGFRYVHVAQKPGQLIVRDAANQEHQVVAPYNILARDFEVDGANISTARAVSNSSYVVIHQLQSALCFDKAFTNDYSAAWASPAKAKAFLKKYQILY